MSTIVYAALMRMLIPPLAFIGWTMLQKGTAFDAFGFNLTDASRFAIALIGATVLGVAARLLAYQADQKNAQVDYALPDYQGDDTLDQAQ